MPKKIEYYTVDKETRRKSQSAASSKEKSPLLRYSSEQNMASHSRQTSNVSVPSIERILSGSGISSSLPNSATTDSSESVFSYSPPDSARSEMNFDRVTSFHSGDIVNNVNNHYYSHQPDGEQQPQQQQQKQRQQQTALRGEDFTVQKFIRCAEQHALEACGESHSPIDLDTPLQKVKLELTCEQDRQYTSEYAFGHQRRSHVEMQTAPRGNVTMEEIFSLALENARKDASSSTHFGPAREKFLKVHGNRVLVTGQAGIGKSTLSRGFVQKILDHEVLPTTKIIFYICIRDIDFDEKLNLVEFLLKYGVSDGDEFSEDQQRIILQEIKKNPNIVFVFDGLDEANTDDIALSPVPRFFPNDKVKVSVLLRSILSGNLLAEAKVLVTCRPRQAFDLSPDYRPGAVIRILGLDTDSQKQIGHQICGKDCGRVYSILHEDPDLETACYVPVFCIILYAVLLKDSRRCESGKPPLNTITRVMTFLLNKYLRSPHMHSIGDGELIKIARLARNGFAINKSVFKLDDISNVGLSKKGFQAFMFSYLDGSTKLKFRVLEGDHNYSFSHRIWQEFFIAIDLMFFATNDDFDRFQSLLMEDTRWEVVAKFMYGLTNVHNMTEFESNFTRFQKFKSNWEKRSVILKTAANMQLKRQSLDSYMLLQICNQVREADDNSFTLQVAKRGLPQTFKLNSVDGSPLCVFSSDVRSILRLLKTAAEYLEENPLKIVDMDQVAFTADSFVRLANGISSIGQTFQSIRLVECWLGCAGTASLAKLLPKFERVHIAYCDITNEQINALYGHYCNMQAPRPEVWVFGLDGSSRDFGYDLKQKVKYFDPEDEETLHKLH